MRMNEIKQLRWPHIDRENGMIRLLADVTKEGRDKSIPTNHHVRNALDTLPRALHHDFIIS